jgi:Asp-tRNA(Asn)/Glu-tRNA(Gln) amidotransferase B subunit
MIEASHPALLMLAGALLLPFLRGTWQKSLSVLVPLLVLIRVAQMQLDSSGQIRFAGIDLVLFQADQLSLVFAWVFSIMAAEGGEPTEIVAVHGLDEQVDIAQIDAIVEQIIAAHPDKVELFRGGQQGLIGFFMGQVMSAAGSGADPRQVQERLRARLSG